MAFDSAEPMTLQQRLEAAQAEGLEPNLRRFLRFRGSHYPCELQAIDCPDGRWTNNRFAHARNEDEAVKLATEAERFGAMGVFVLFNTIAPAVASRAAAGKWHVARKGESTSDADVRARVLLFGDVDATRPRGTASDDAELALTFPIAEEIALRFPPESVGFGHSGNGAGVYVALDALAESPATAELIKRILAALATKHAASGVELDTSVCDAKRLCPAFGTTKRKGAGVPERPHRRTAFIASVAPRRLTMAELEQVAELIGAGEAPKPTATAERGGKAAPAPNARFAWANDLRIEVVLGWLGLLNGDQAVCPGCSEQDGSAVEIYRNGLKCLHKRCQGRGVNGFYTVVDAVAQAKGIAAREAVTLLEQHFGFAPPRPVSATKSARPTAAPKPSFEVPERRNFETAPPMSDDEAERFAIENQDVAPRPTNWDEEDRRRRAEEPKRRGRARWTIIGAAEIMAPLPPIPWVVEGIDLAPGPVSIFAGYGYSGKTAAAQALAVAVATGTRAWGAYDVRQGRALHVDYEQGNRLTRERYQRLLKGLGASGTCSEAQMAQIMTSLGCCISPPDFLDSPRAFEAWCEELDGCTLAIIDSFRAAAPTIDENASIARAPLDMLGRVSDKTGCTIVVIHHGRKAQQNGGASAKQEMRGSSAIFDAGQLVLQLTSDGAPAPGKGVNYAISTSTKARITGRAIPSLSWRFEDVNEHGELDPTSRYGLRVIAEPQDDGSDKAADEAIDEVGERVLAFIRKHAGCSTEELKIGVKGNASVKAAAVARLKRDGAIRNGGGHGGRGGPAAWFPT